MGEIPLSPGDGKVADGIRYHVLDVWVDGLLGVEGWEEEVVMRPIEKLKREGRTKVVRERAEEVLRDERLREGEEGGGDVEDGNNNEEWEGFGE